VVLSVNVGWASFLIGFGGVNVLELDWKVGWSGVFSFYFFV
jgi:hypothetical protein